MVAKFENVNPATLGLALIVGGLGAINGALTWGGWPATAALGFAYFMVMLAVMAVADRWRVSTPKPDGSKCQRRGCETKPVAGSDFCAVHGGGRRVIG